MLIPEFDGSNQKEWNRRWQAGPMSVQNARLIDPPPTLETFGFELVRLETQINERQSPLERINRYVDEAEKAVYNLCNCKETSSLNVVFRGSFNDKLPGEPVGQSAAEYGSIYSYATYAHTDISPWLEMQPLWNAFANKRHCAIYNVWRSTDLSNPVENMPLAVCDLRSVAHGDMIAACIPGVLPDGNPMIGYNLARNFLQSWFYYPNMTHEEALVLKLYDTRQPVCSLRGVFHTAVNDPNSTYDAKRRESVDIRIGAVFEEESDYDARRAQFLADLPPVPNELHPRASVLSS